jgi:hypothetical protein
VADREAISNIGMNLKTVCYKIHVVNVTAT